jgi:hypothetical protein
MTARTLAALAANPGCNRRALLDAAGVDKAAVAERMGEPAPFGQSQFAIVRGNAFEARVKADGCRELLALLRERFGLDAPAEEVALPDLGAKGAEPGTSAAAERIARARAALAAATASGGWTVLDHPLLALDVSGSPAHLEPDAVVVRPDGRWTVIEIKSFPLLDGSADPAQVGAAARQAAVYVLALHGEAARLAAGDGGSAGTAVVEESVLLVCPRDFSNQPIGARVDVRKQIAVTRRQLARSTRISEIVEHLPAGVTFDLRPEGTGRRRTLTRDPAELRQAVDAVPAAYAPDCLSTCELAFHCRSQARACGAVESLGRGVRGELGGLRTVTDIRAAASAPADPASAEVGRLLREAAALRAEALKAAGWA